MLAYRNAINLLQEIAGTSTVDINILNESNEFMDYFNSMLENKDINILSKSLDFVYNNF